MISGPAKPLRLIKDKREKNEQGGVPRRESAASRKVVYAADDPGSFFLPGNLVVGLDFGKEISEAERDQFRVSTSISDGKGGEYECIAAMTCGSMGITRGDKNYQFGPCIFFSFDVEKGVPNYKIKLEDYSPFNLGDPFTEPIYPQ